MRVICKQSNHQSFPHSPLVLFFTFWAGLVSAAPYVQTITGERPEPIVAVEDVCAWPNLTVLPDGTIAAAIFNQPNHGTSAGDVDVWTSGDDGATWQYAGTPAPHEPNTNRMNHAAGLAADGDLLVISSGWSNVPPSGFRSGILDPWLCRSSDNGETWTVDTTSVPNVSPRGYPIVPYGDIVEGADGVLRAAVYDWPGYSPRIERAYIMHSYDGGATWGDFVALDPSNIRNETTLLNLNGDNWLAVARTLGEDMYYYRSTDNGRTWQPQGQITGYYEHPGHLMRLQDGRILLTYGDRNSVAGVQGIEVLVSDDEGASWDLNYRVCDYLGPDGGYPSSVQLADGQILTAFYASGLVGSHNGYVMGAATWDPASLIYEVPEEQEGTLGYWRFNEKAGGQWADSTAGAILDASGNDKHGTAVGNPMPFYVSSSEDSPSAIHLTQGGSVEDRIVVPHSSLYKHNMDVGDYYPFVADINPSPAGATNTTKRETTGPGYALRLQPEGYVGIYLEGTSDFTYPDARGTINVADGEWHHVAVVVDSSADTPSDNRVRIYVDRRLDSDVLLRSISYDGTGIGEDLSNQHDLWIGDFIGRPGDQFIGDLDVLRISFGALTPDEFLRFRDLPGDLNGDGAVNSGDLDLVRGNWGTTVTPGTSGDANGDGVVDSGDLDIVRANWGATLPGSVPEPSLVTFLVVFATIVIGRWFRKP